VTEGRPSFDSREEAEAFCREREGEEPDASWLAWQGEDGRWTAARTNLPRHEDPRGTATEAKPRPPEGDDPRTGLARDVPPYA